MEKRPALLLIGRNDRKEFNVIELAHLISAVQTVVRQVGKQHPQADDDAAQHTADDAEQNRPLEHAGHRGGRLLGHITLHGIQLGFVGLDALLQVGDVLHHLLLALLQLAIHHAHGGVGDDGGGVLGDGVAKLFPQVVVDKAGDLGGGLLVLRSGADDHNALVAVAVLDGDVAHAVPNLDVAGALDGQQLIDVLDLDLLAQDVADTLVQLGAAVGVAVGADQLAGLVGVLVVLAGCNLVAGVNVKDQLADRLIVGVQIVVDTLLSVGLQAVQPLLIPLDGIAQALGGGVVLVQRNLVVVQLLLHVFPIDGAVAAPGPIRRKEDGEDERDGQNPLKLFEKQDEHILKGNFLALNALMHVGLSFPFPMLSNPF